MGVKQLLSEAQRNELMDLSRLTEWDLVTFHTFSKHDLHLIFKHRRGYNRLGFALQLALIRYPGWALTEYNDIPMSVIKHIARQLQIPAEGFSKYANRNNTLWEHLSEIREEYNFTNFSSSHEENLLKHLTQQAMENSNSLHLIEIALSMLRKSKVILPAMYVIENIVWEAKQQADQKVYSILYDDLTSEQKKRIDALLLPTNNGISPLAWLKQLPSQPSPESFLKVVERFEYVKDIGLVVDTSKINSNRLRQLARLGSKYEPYAFRRFDEVRRYSILVAFMLEITQDLIDYAIEIHDRIMMNLQLKGKKAQDEMQKVNGKKLNEKLVQFIKICGALIEAKEVGKDAFTALDDVMPWDKMVESVEEAKQLSRPISYDYLDLLETRYSYIRRYAPTLLRVFQFGSTKSAEPVLQALHTIHDLNINGKRKVPMSAPLNFVSNRWQKHVYDDEGNVNRHYYELAALTELRNYIRSGDVFVSGSRQHKAFDDYLISEEDWRNIINAENYLAVPLTVEEYLTERITSLNQRLDWLSKNSEKLEGVDISQGKLYVERLDKGTPEEAKAFSIRLHNMLPRIKLTDLLLEVSSWTGFHEQFIHASTNKSPDKEEKNVVLATLMAMGTNIGLTKMAEATPGISYRQMANTAQWRMYDDAMVRAQSVLVNFQHRRQLATYWGDGNTSSSDGMRVPIGVRSLHADSNPHYGTGRGATIYRFISDQFASFYLKVINTNARDALYVLDGLLHHETDLMIEEHYTDTAGYTDQVFGLTHLLGFRFAPRIRDLMDTKLFTINGVQEYPNVQSLLKGKINLKVIQENYNDVLRLAYSVRTGKVSSSLIMGKLGSYARQNKLATALGEMGRIEKTIFTLDYISSKSVRRKIQKGLNKGEATNALARAIFFGKSGEFRERALQDQLQRASALNIIINAISVWNTVYMEKAVEELKDTGEFREDLMPYIWPLGWEHINFLGEYKFEGLHATSLQSLRPLNIKEPIYS
ncbi:TPA: Tn3 family transposase [Bacillus paranthracis]|uniref:DDE transposase n=1 Tax=Bacillus thuringiensis subsp. darmstadiensis TaxID=132264 RepID=A0A9X6G3N2_BACUD|nr:MULTISPECIES: Tn3 family transposase [Bacillus cereus group]MDA1850255.1 Tn3 family transposase [Bacillus cereus]OUA67985.1 DDE transposase [Bacillus thuringiensis serovar thailandensis]ADH09928.1 transposase [Bacillus thuringiensis BMB171]MEC1632635.1 Tn3 family transposase [Bacillus paranthracis]OTZ33595.1 DDE transposase [Bacillus thuringiensis serovar darmstadiensis]